MDLVETIERYDERFREKYGTRVTHKQKQAIAAVLDCRAGHYGAVLLNCSSCARQQLSYQPCGHRSCHRCQNYDTTCWLERQSRKLLPVDYFMVTFTLPHELRSLTWHNQKEIYSILFESAVSTLKTFGINDKRLGAEMGMTAVLHSHTRRLDFHPHVHIIVPGGCLNRERRQWKKLHGNYLFNEFNLATVFRARFLESINDTNLSLSAKIPAKWVVNCKQVGKGLPALKYLSRYLYRGVISEQNIIHDDGTYVTFRYTDGETGEVKTRREKGETFLWLVFQHVLPKGFRRVRDYGYLNGNAKNTLRLIQLVLKVFVNIPLSPRPSYKCSGCGQAMSIIRLIPPAWRSG